MQFALDPKVDVSDAKTITLAGETFFVAKMMLRQMRVIGPELATLIKMFNRASRVLSGLSAADAADKAALERGDLTEADALVRDQDRRAELVHGNLMTEAESDAALKVLATALSRTYPKITRDDLLDMPINYQALIEAIRIVMEQTKMVGPGEGKPDQGEAQATSQSTGTSSSPTS